MSKVLMEIELGNDAMQTGHDIATATQKVSFILEGANIRKGLKVSIFDENGNNVGFVRVLIKHLQEKSCVGRTLVIE